MRSDSLNEVSKILEALITDRQANNFIVPDNGPDESMLVGTEDSFLRLAAVLVDLVRNLHGGEGGLVRDIVGGESACASNQIKLVFDEFSPVWPVCAYIFTDKHAFARAVQALCSKGSHDANS